MDGWITMPICQDEFFLLLIRFVLTSKITQIRAHVWNVAHGYKKICCCCDCVRVFSVHRVFALLPDGSTTPCQLPKTVPSTLRSPYSSPRRLQVHLQRQQQRKSLRHRVSHPVHHGWRSKIYYFIALYYAQEVDNDALFSCSIYIYDRLMAW